MLATLSFAASFAAPDELSRIGNASSPDLISVRVRKSSSARAARAHGLEFPGDPHYGDPATGCRSDEADTTIDNVSGDFCAPSCDIFDPCPTDKPSGVTADPECVLRDPTDNKQYCALVCSVNGASDQCDVNASCKTIAKGIGICTYDD